MYPRFIALIGLSFFVAAGCSSSRSESQSGKVKGGLSKWRYAHPAVRRNLKRFDAAARKMTNDKWHHHEWHDNGYVYSTSWCRPPMSPGNCFAGVPQKPFHRIALSTKSLQKKREPVRGFSLWVTWIPPEDGWDLQLNYWRTRAKDPSEIGDENLKLAFSKVNPEKKAPGRPPAIHVTIPARWGMKKRYGDREYHLSASRPRRKRVLQVYMKSPQAFRDAVLKDLDDLETRVRATIRSGHAVWEMLDYSRMQIVQQKSARGGKPRGEKRPTRFRRPIPGKYKLSPAQQRELLQDALATIDRRRGIVRTSYKELFATVQHAFPLAEVAQEVEGP